MRRPVRLTGSLAAVGLVAAVGAALAPPVAAQAGVEHHAYRVIADHLNNPRGLAPAPGGGLYLAEAGSGGKTCFSGGETGTTCVGRTGSLDRVTRDRVTRLVTGLISGSGKGGVGAEGPVSVSAGPEGSVYGQFAMSSHELPPPGVLPAKLRAAAKAQLGHLVLATPRGSVTSISDVGGQDWAWTNAHKYLAPRDFPDANPNAVLNVGGHRYVVDAGANALVEVKRDGTAKLAAFFGVPRGAQSDAVPTCVARGPDGALYVGELLGGFYAPGHARIWRVVPGHAPAVWARGLTTVQGCGFGADGAFYATEFQVAGFNQGPGAGDVVRIDNEGHRTHLRARKLFYPSGFAAGPGDTVYVSNCSIAPAHGISPQVCSTGGQVVRVG